MLFNVQVSFHLPFLSVSSRSFLVPSRSCLLVAMTMAMVPIDRQLLVREYNYYMDGKRTGSLFNRSRTFRRACGSSRRLIVETFEEEEEKEEEQQQTNKQ